MKSTPELRQFGALTPNDFIRSPIWVQCHIIDHDEPWHHQTDEETFRPWAGAVPVDPQEAMFLVRATFELADGTRFPGFVTPAQVQELGMMQPSLFTERGQRVSFWHGIFLDPKEREVAYSALGKTASQVFPIRFAAESTLSRGVASGSIEGFYSIPEGSKGKVRIER